jgi:hemolysin activation/secretion protein
LGYIGVFVEPKAEDIDVAGRDLRGGNNTALHFEISVAIVKDVRTVAQGRRIPYSARLNNELHGFIRAMSPIRPGDILKRDVLDDYVSRLNRSAARRVDVTIAAADEAGEVSLDYLVSENKKTFAYAQISNTGTKTTNRWRERIGLVSHHFLKNDAVFNFDYITASFDESHAMVASYEAPLSEWDSTRWRIDALWSQYDASEVSITSERFHGEEAKLGIELIENFYAQGDLFADVFTGIEWRNIMVRNQVALYRVREDFILPRVGVRLSRDRDTSQIHAKMTLEGNLPSVAGTRANHAEQLGRLDVDKSWVTLQWSGTYSFFLEPIIYPDGWQDPATPETSTLAHEIALMFAGQYAFGHRLSPQFESIVGGFYTVRGYSESVAAGDNAYVGTVEYRCHIPRRFKPQPSRNLPLLGRFKLAPQNVYDKPDWDLIFRTFVDCGYTTLNSKRGREKDESLASTGVGVELQVRNNVNIRCDYGIALTDAGDVDPGDSKVHVSATLMW